MTEVTRRHHGLALGLFAALAGGCVGAAPAVAQVATWQPLAQNIDFCQSVLLLTDGSVFQAGLRAVPDISGNYVNMTAASFAPLLSGYSPGAKASAVLPDGRVIYEGGECSTQANCQANILDFTNMGQIFDPLSNTWSMVPPPSGWTTIGGAPSAVLANGLFMMGRADQSGTTQEALLDPLSLTWIATGAGKADANLEEGWTLLPNGNVLTIDTNHRTNPTSAEIYNPATGAWTSAGTTAVQLGNQDEMGPQVLRPDGTVIVFGALSTGTDHSAIYNSTTGVWTAGPDMPTINGQTYTAVDGPAALLPNGNVLVGLSPSPSHGIPPTHYFEFDGKNLNPVPDPPNAASIVSTDSVMLVLPTGQILLGVCNGVSGAGHSLIYTPTGNPNPAWAPAITSVPTTLVPGATYQLSGLQLNGLSQGAMYGDDSQDASNYPLVRITNNASGHVFYARTFGHSSMSVAPNMPSFTNFTLPASGKIETGASSLVAVANGVVSQPVAVNVVSGGTVALSVSLPVNGGIVTSSPAGLACPGNCTANFASGTVVSLTETPATGFAFTGWGGACSGVGTCTVALNQAQNVSASFTQGSLPASSLVAAVLPESRSAVVNHTVTAFATIINSGGGVAPACAIASTGGLPLNFLYQTTNPSTNALTGTANTPVDIQAGAAQSFVIALTPTATFVPVQANFRLACNNIAPAPVYTGLNTLLLSSSATPVPDVVALAATPPNDGGTLPITGVIGTPGCAGCGLNAFAVATVNVGSGDAITATGVASPTTLPLVVTICQTNAFGVCVGGPAGQGPSATLIINPNDTPTFAVFAAASGAVPFVPQTNRIFVQFTDSHGTVRGATSVAVTAQ